MMDPKKNLPSTTTGGPLLHSIFRSRNSLSLSSANSLTNARHRPSRKDLQNVNEQQMAMDQPAGAHTGNRLISTPFDIHKNLQMESSAEKQFHMKWHQVTEAKNKKRKARVVARQLVSAQSGDHASHHGLNVHGGALGTSASVVSVGSAEGATISAQQMIENDIEDLIDEQEGLVVSSATEGLFDEYAKKKKWSRTETRGGSGDRMLSATENVSSPVSAQHSQNTITRILNTDPHSVIFYHSSDLDSQRIELQFWESQVRWIQKRRRLGTRLQLSEYATKRWRSIGWGELPDEMDDPLEWQHIPKSRVNEWNEIQKRRESHEQQMLDEMQRAAENRIEKLKQSANTSGEEDEEMGEVEEHVSTSGAESEDDSARHGGEEERIPSPPAVSMGMSNLPASLQQSLAAKNIPNGLRVSVPSPGVGRLSSLMKDSGAPRNSPLSSTITTNVQPTFDHKSDEGGAVGALNGADILRANVISGGDGGGNSDGSVPTSQNVLPNPNLSPKTISTVTGEQKSQVPQDPNAPLKRKRGRPRKKRPENEPKDSSSTNDTTNTHPQTYNPPSDLPDGIPDLKNSIIQSGDFLNGILWRQPENAEELKSLPFTKLLIDANDKNLHLIDVDTLSHQGSRAASSTSIEISENDEFMNAVKGAIITEHKENLITRHQIRHSGPAERLDPVYYPTHISDPDYRNYYHQELLRLPTHMERLQIAWKPQKEAKRKKRTQKVEERLKKKTEQRSILSAHNHRSILIESVERYPMIVNKTGMGTRVVNYYPQKRFGEIKEEDCSDGDLRFVENSQELPLFTELDEEHGVMSTENENYNAQLFPYKPPHTDFLLTARNRGSRIVKFHIRRPDAYYTMGHTQPLRVVPSIPSREVDILKSNRVLQFIKDRFQETGRDTGESYVVKKDIEAAFPPQKHLIREHLRSVAASIGGGRYAMKPDVLIAEKLVTPEEIACYDMTKADDVRMADMGIDQETQKVAFGTAFDLSQNFAVPDKLDQDTIRRMSHIILDASWRKTAEFHNLISASAERNFSLLEVSRATFDSEKLRRMSEECKRLAHEELDKQRHEGVNLTDDQAKRILKEQGNFKDEKIEVMSRTERKDKARILTESFSKVSESRKKLYIQILSEKKKQALRRVYAVQADKLRTGRPLYQSLENQRAVMNQDDEDDDRSETSSVDDASDDEHAGGVGLYEEEEYMDDETELNNQLRDMVGDDDMGVGMDTQSDLGGDQNGNRSLTSDGYRVVRTLLVKEIQPDTGKSVHREVRQIITDPDLVDLYRKRDAFRRKSNKNKKQIYIYTKEDKHMSDIFVTGKKEHRRLREQYKRWHKRVKKKHEDPRLSSLANGEQTKKRARSRTGARDGAPKMKRRRKISLKVANERLRKIIGNYTKNNKWKAFNEPVDLVLFPDYNEHISRGITLKEVYHKAKMDQYKNVPEFEKDLQTIEDNCRKYCGEIHPEHAALIPLVEDLMAAIRTQLEKYREDVERAFHGETVEILIAKGQAPPELMEFAGGQQNQGGSAKTESESAGTRSARV